MCVLINCDFIRHAPLWAIAVAFTDLCLFRALPLAWFSVNWVIRYEASIQGLNINKAADRHLTRVSMAVTIAHTDPILQNTEWHETQIKRYREMNYASLNILFGSTPSPMTSFEKKPPFPDYPISSSLTENSQKTQTIISLSLLLSLHLWSENISENRHHTAISISWTDYM